MLRKLQVMLLPKHQLKEESHRLIIKEKLVIPSHFQWLGIFSLWKFIGLGSTNCLFFKFAQLFITNKKFQYVGLMNAHRHFVVHKPYGFLSQFITKQTKRRKNKRLLGELFDFPEGIMAIGRLDLKSEGLLFLTTDGKVSEQVRGNSVEKEYYVQLDGLIDQKAIEHIQKGVTIGIDRGKYRTKDCKAKLLETAPDFPERIRRIRGDAHGPTSWLSITIKEGKFRQVRKMTAAVGFPTLRLVRVRIGGEKLTDWTAGSVKEVCSFNLA